MKNKLMLLTVVAVLLVVAAVPAFAAGPDFGEAVYADGETWGTKATANLPAPNKHNRQSFDGLFVIQEGAVPRQLPIAEAAPGNPDYNGGRWILYYVDWKNGTPELVTSYAQLRALIEAGDVSVTEAGTYFQCPLLPVQ